MALPLCAQEAADPAKADRQAAMKKHRDLMTAMKKREREVITNNPELKKQLEELELQRVEALKAADPELGDLIKQVEAFRAEQKAKWQNKAGAKREKPVKQPGKGKKPAGKGNKAAAAKGRKKAQQ